MPCVAAKTVSNAQVNSIAKEVGVAFLTLGFDPKWQVGGCAHHAQEPI